MKKETVFKVGDKVFAKVKGYPAWPAMIIEDKTSKYNVQFYGTSETAVVKSKDLFYYIKHKKTFIKTLKRKDYNDAIEEIEKAIKEDGGSDGNSEVMLDSSDTVTSTVILQSEAAKNKRKRSASIDKVNGNPPKKQSVGSNPETGIVDSHKEDKEGATKNPTVKKKTVPERSPKKSSTKRLSNIQKAEVKNTSTQQSEEMQTKLLVEAENDKENQNNNDTLADDDPKVLASDIKIITEEYLNAIISYAAFLRRDKETYKKKHVESREMFSNGTVLTKLPSGKFIGIKYNRDPIPPINNEFDRAIHDEVEAKTILALKKLLEDGKCDPECDKDLFVHNIHISESEIQEIVRFEIIEHKKSKINMLKIESTLIECDAKIKKCLGLDQAQPKLAVEYLEQVLHLDVQPLMLKKHPHVVEMVRRLRRYIGNVSEWNFTKEQSETFEMDAAEIRAKADDVFFKFSQLFDMPNDTLFWEVFSDEVENFKDHVKGMLESLVFSLTSEPNSRQSFLDKIEDEEEMKIIVSKLEKNKSDTDSTYITAAPTI